MHQLSGKTGRGTSKEDEDNVDIYYVLTYVSPSHFILNNSKGIYVIFIL